jgi:5-(carboxyamino)imidazole ribonucleotide synthase
VVANREQAIAAFQHFKGETCVLEQKLALDYEVSVVLARDETGIVTSFPVAENSHRKGILDVSLVPARAATATARRAAELAAKIAEGLRYIGTLAVEFFVVRGELMINEMAPRPHNSGHYTIDACITSQYEQQVRALCGLPLGEARAHSAAAMVNLLGDSGMKRPGRPSLPRTRLVEAARLSCPQAASLRQASRPPRSQDGTLHRSR